MKVRLLNPLDTQTVCTNFVIPRTNSITDLRNLLQIGWIHSVLKDDLIFLLSLLKLLGVPFSNGDTQCRIDSSTMFKISSFSQFVTLISN